MNFGGQPVSASDTPYDGILVGLEVHQQLDTGSKLFCRCLYDPARTYDNRVVRSLRPAMGEDKRLDHTAVFEGSRNREFTYMYGSQTCLVERDEAPPAVIDPESLRAALRVAGMLKCRLSNEIYVMRKTIVDGSNTSGFQRTALVGTGGSIKVGKSDIGIEAVCIEEDSAERVPGNAGTYGLSRLGMPLIEVSTRPFSPGITRPDRVARAISSVIGRTGVARTELGSIRQDVNMSIDGGEPVEIKGIQSIWQIREAVVSETYRMRGIMCISRTLAGWRHDPAGICEIEGIYEESRFNMVDMVQKPGDTVVAVNFPGLRGKFSNMINNTSLESEIKSIIAAIGDAEIAFSDEFNCSISRRSLLPADIEDEIRGLLRSGDRDAFMIIVAPRATIMVIINTIIARMEYIRDRGIPHDTRMFRPHMATSFMRPRAGPSRMYPETDLPPIIVNESDIREAARFDPPTTESRIRLLVSKYGLNWQIASQLADSAYYDVFARIAGTDPVFAASVICHDIKSVERGGGRPERLGSDLLEEAFGMLSGGVITRGGLVSVITDIMDGSAESVLESVEKRQLGVARPDEIMDAVKRAVKSNPSLAAGDGDTPIGPLMGIIMNEMRGCADGARVAECLKAVLARRNGA